MGLLGTTGSARGCTAFFKEVIRGKVFLKDASRYSGKGCGLIDGDLVSDNAYWRVSGINVLSFFDGHLPSATCGGRWEAWPGACGAD